MVNLSIDGQFLRSVSSTVVESAASVNLARELTDSADAALAAPGVTTALLDGMRQHGVRARLSENALTTIGALPADAAAAFETPGRPSGKAVAMSWTHDNPGAGDRASPFIGTSCESEEDLVKAVTRSTVAAALTMMICSGLAACAPPPKTPEQEHRMPTPQENRDKLSALFDETQDLLGDEWTSEDDPTPLPCDPVSGGKGVQFSLYRVTTGTPDSEEQQAIAARVAAFWETRGYSTTRSESASLGPEVQAVNGQRSTLLFGINENAMLLSGGSDCTPGNFEEIMDQLREEEAATPIE